MSKFQMNVNFRPPHFTFTLLSSLQTDRLSANSRAGSLFAPTDDDGEAAAERARKELPWYRGVTWKDVKDIMRQ